MRPPCPSLQHPITEKIAWAMARDLDCGARVVKEPLFEPLLYRLKEAIQSSREAMLDCGMDALCRKCEEEEGGSCCGAGIENRYDPWLLWINLLLGAPLPDRRFREGSCFFLGGRGCVLEARHVICINYLCRKAEENIDPLKLQVLRDREGEEIEALFHLHEALKKAVRT